MAAVHAAIEFQCSDELIALLLERGAEPYGRGQDPWSAHELAVRQGRDDIAKLLRSHSAQDDTTPVDRFLSACIRADRAEAERRLTEHPGLLATLTAEDHRALTHAADHGDVSAVRLMLDLGFPIDAPVGDDGATPARSSQCRRRRGCGVPARSRGRHGSARHQLAGHPAVLGHGGQWIRLGHCPDPIGWQRSRS